MRSPACWTMPVTTSLDAVDVLVVHHLALGLADPLQDHLLRGLRGDAAEVVGRDVLALDLLVGHLRPVDVEVVVGEQRVVLLAGLLLDPLELVERALARLVEQAALEVLGQLDREDAEVARVVELDRRMSRRARRLLVGGEQRVLERGDAACPTRFPSRARSRERPRRSPGSSRTYPSSIRLARTIASYGMSTGSPVPFTSWNDALAGRRRPRRAACAVGGLQRAPAGRPHARSARACAAAARFPARRPRST